MNISKIEFLKGPEPENVFLKSLYRSGQGDWDGAHDLVNDATTTEAAWIHAYLHREEGDEWNAGYWYRRADKPVFQGSLEKEWNILLEYFHNKYG